MALQYEWFNQRPDNAVGVLLLSIQPQHSERIFRGAKLYELRKSLPRAPFKRVYLYESGIGVAGYFDPGGVLAEPVDKLWSIVGEAATTKDRFHAYFANTDRGVAIRIQHPCRFSSPIKVEALRQADSRFRAPLSFILLQPDHPLYAFLEARRSDELAMREALAVTLEPIRVSDRATFIENVTEIVSRNYDDITQAFARNLLRVHDAGRDENGFLTVSKTVLSVLGRDGALLGFTVLTEKRGGSAKTGPTLLLPEFRGKGYAAAMRNAIEDLARERRIRKLYSTCSERAEVMIKHLLRAGYRVEGHLQRQYTIRHSELVFGKVLSPGEPQWHLATLPSRAARVASAVELDRERAAKVFGELFSERFGGISDRTAKRILASDADGSFEQKPRHFLFLKSGAECVGVAVLIPKRGGAFKCVILTGTAHLPSLRSLVGSVEKHATALGARKVFVSHPADDGGVIRILSEKGFVSEGVVREPYRPGRDELILSRFIL